MPQQRKHLLAAAGVAGFLMTPSLGLGFDHIIGGPGRDGVRKMTSLADGGAAAIGWQAQHGIYQDGMGVLLRLNEQGDVLWSRALSSTGRNQGAAVTETANGELLVSLEEYPQESAPGQVVILRLSADGQPLSTTNVGGPGKEVADVIHELPNGDVVLGGEQSSTAGADMAAWVTRLDATLTPNWSWSFDTPGRDRINAVVQHGDRLIAAGNSTAPFSDERQEQPLFAQLDSDGTEIWQREPKVGRAASVRALAVLEDGGVLFAGYAKRPSSGEFDGWIGRLSAEGEVLWQTPLGNDGPDFLHSVILMNGGDAMAAGAIRPPGSEHYEGLLIAFSLDGTWIEEIRVDRPGSTQIRSVLEKADGAFLLGGSFTPDGTKNEQLWINQTILP